MLTRGPRSIAAAALSAATALSTAARAEEPADVDLRWSAPGACPDEARVRAAVERLAGRPLRSPGRPRVPVWIDAAAAGEGAWTARIAIEHPGDAAPRERWIHGATCAEVADAAAVVVAVALTAVPPPRRAPAPAPLLVAPPSDRPVEPAPPEPRLHPGLRVSGGADFVSLPAPAFGVEVAGALAFGANRVELSSAAWLPQTAESASRAMASARLSLYAAGARYCRAFLQGSLELAGCAGIEAGALLGSSNGVTHPGSGASPWVAPGLGVLGLWGLSRRLSLALGLEGLAPVVRESFQIAGLGELYRPPPLTARALLGLEAHFR